MRSTKSSRDERRKWLTSGRIPVIIKTFSLGESSMGISRAVRIFPVRLMIAASIMYQRLQLLRNASVSDLDVNIETLEISEAYLAVINALSCVAERNAWIFAYKLDDPENTDSPVAKRIKRDDKGIPLFDGSLLAGGRRRMALSLQDIKKEYEVELERQQVILGKIADEYGLEGYDL